MQIFLIFLEILDFQTEKAESLKELDFFLAIEERKIYYFSWSICKKNVGIIHKLYCADCSRDFNRIPSPDRGWHCLICLNETGIDEKVFSSCLFIAYFGDIYHSLHRKCNLRWFYIECDYQFPKKIRHTCVMGNF